MSNNMELSTLYAQKKMPLKYLGEIISITSQLLSLWLAGSMWVKHNVLDNCFSDHKLFPTSYVAE